MEEVWKPIEGYEGYYEISNIGRARSLDRYVPYKRHQKNQKKLLKGKILPQFKTRNGYLRVAIFDSNAKKAKLVLIHRLVAMAFIPNPRNKREVNHINGIKTDNKVENLEWCTSSENKIHALKNGLCKNEKPVLQIKNGEVVAEFKSATEAYKILGYEAQLIGKVALGKRKSAYGYQWKFKEKET